MLQCWMYHANLIGGLAGAAVRTPVAWGIHNSGLSPAHGVSVRVANWLCARLCRHLPTVIISCSVRAQCHHSLNGYNGALWKIVPNGYDLGIFAPDQDARDRLRSELKVGAGEVLVGMVARWHPDKSHSTFLKAAALLESPNQPYRWVLIGPGMSSDNRELAELLVTLGLKEKFLLLGPRPDCQSAFKRDPFLGLIGVE
jgi:glycosyltransferase involved in cell wall biosynthesis